MNIRIFIPILFLIPFLLPTQSLALSCVSSEDDVWFASYEESEYINGFTVEHVLTGNGCDARPVVKDTDSTQEIFDRLIVNYTEGPKTGVFQVSAKCVSEGEEDSCFPVSSLERVSSNSEELVDQKLVWLQKAQNATRISTTHKWFSLGLLITIFCCVVFWPWILILRWPHLHTRLTFLLVVAIPIQIVTIFIMPAFYLSYDMVTSMSKLAANLLMFVILFEILYLIISLIQKNKKGRLPTKK